MEQILLDLDILAQLRLEKAAANTGKTRDELIAAALEHFLSLEGFNNLTADKETAAA